VDPTRRLRLLQSKLTALAGHPQDGLLGPFPSGATLTDRSSAWLLVEDAGPRALGGAMLWAHRHGCSSLRVVLDPVDSLVASDLSRRAGATRGVVSVWTLDGDQLCPVEPDGAHHEQPAPPGVDPLVELLVAEGCEVVIEDGVVRGEWLGLEVARIEDLGDGWTLQCGVGRFDREAGAMMRAGTDAPQSLRSVLSVVRAARHPGAPPHPMRDMCRERWLRAALLVDSSAIGVSALVAMASGVPRVNLRDPHPALALGRDSGGRVLVAATVGVDVDLVGVIAGVVADDSTIAEIVVVHPVDRPLLDAAREVFAWLGRPTRFVGVPAPWELASTAVAGTESDGATT